MGPGIRLIDSATETASEVSGLLGRGGIGNSSGKSPAREFFVTDSPEGFRSVGERFLGQAIENITKVQLEVMQ